jgi:hypothetical protein
MPLRRKSVNDDIGLIFKASSTSIYELIKDNASYRKTEKDKYGEVFTPKRLIDDMLDQLPRHLWSDPRLKWLDPACGVGNFPVSIFYRLDDGLKRQMPNTRHRRNHIIRNMLYMVELNKTNYNVVRRIFGDDANVFHGSFLDDGWSEEFGGSSVRYDVVVGNPPYNQGGTRIGGNVFWKQFVFGALDVLADDGYLCFVHPPGWRKMTKDRASAGDIWQRYDQQGHLVYLNMDNSPRYKADGFPTVDFYVWRNLKKSTTAGTTQVAVKFDSLRYDGKLNLGGLPFIPSYVDPSVISILHKLGKVPEKDRLSVVHSQAFKASVRDTTRRNRKATGATRRNGHRGIVVFAHGYDHTKHTYTMAYRSKGDKKASRGDIERPKVVMTFNGAKENGCLYTVYYGGKVGTTASTMYQLVSGKSEGERLVRFLNSDFVIAMLKITQYSDRPNHKNEFHLLNMLPNVARSGVANISLTRREADVVRDIVSRSKCE